MSIMEYNGGSVLAMKGKDCVAIACDLRMGMQALTVSCDFNKTFQINQRLFYGLAGLATDVQTFSENARFRTNLYKLRERREIEPVRFVNMIASMQYQRRFGYYFVEPVFAGLDKDNKPHVWANDIIGCINEAEDFAVTGTASEQLYGMCESLWREGMNEDELFEVISQSFMNGIDRDCRSGWGVLVHIITPTKVITRTLKSRMD